MTAPNEYIVIALFNGTPINFPFFAPAKTIFESIEKNVSSYYEDEVELFYNQTVEIQKQLCINSKRGFVGEKQILITANEFGFECVDKFIIMWFCNIYYLLQKGKIADDEHNGFVTMLGNGIVENVTKFFKAKYKNSALCGLCNIKATMRCKNCQQNYCCREHQIQDWKKHSTVCSRK